MKYLKRRTLTAVLASILLVGIPSGALHGQQRSSTLLQVPTPEAFVPDQPAPEVGLPIPAERDGGSLGKLAAGGAAGALAGTLIGALAGAAASPLLPCNDDLGGFGHMAVGAGAGSTMATPTFVHLANDRQGQYLPSLAASGAIAFGVFHFSSGDANAGLLAIPLLQIASSVLIERLTAP